MKIDYFLLHDLTTPTEWSCCLVMRKQERGPSAAGEIQFEGAMKHRFDQIIMINSLTEGLRVFVRKVRPIIEPPSGSSRTDATSDVCVCVYVFSRA